LAEWDWREVQLMSNINEWNGPLPNIPDDATYHFEPHFGWKGHIERKRGAMASGNGHKPKSGK